MEQPLVRQLCAALGLAIGVFTAPSTSEAQTCAVGTQNSCLTVSFTPVRPTPVPSDFAAGVAVLGVFAVTVLKCGQPPCELSMAAADQPVGGLRIRVGGAEPTAISQCPINLTGITSVPSAAAPVIALVNVATTVSVWVCRPLSWDPAVTPAGSASPEFRFRLRQG